MELKFSTSWFVNDAKAIWDGLIPQILPRRILEIGSFEGASTCYLIQNLANRFPIEIFCIDTWSGGIEHSNINFLSVEENFNNNTKIVIDAAAHPVALTKIKLNSFAALARLVSEGKKGFFDFIYVDGSHQAPDVLSDAVLAFELLAEKGVMVFDDYIWSEKPPQGTDPLRCPKIAVDAFVNINIRKLRIIRGPLYQFFIQKVAP